MARIFGRGELKVALLHVLAEVESANGYTIMRRLADEVGAGWRPSPGAIYPALLALEDAGLITGHDDGGSRSYRLTDSGRGACGDRPGLLGHVAHRASARHRITTLGTVLDAFCRDAADRGRTLDGGQQRAVRAVLASTTCHIASILEQGADHD